MAKPYKKSTDAELLNALTERCIARGEANAPGIKNKQFGIMVKLSCELLSRGDSVHPKILLLPEHPRPHVRGWAAFVALEIDSPLAEPVLEELGRTHRGNLDPGFSSRFALEQWRKGALKTLSSWGYNKVVEIRRTDSGPHTKS